VFEKLGIETESEKSKEKLVKDIKNYKPKLV
jgi:hypothetical protein